jgi:NADH dehydrogenase FAD-containing subunit
MSRKKLAVVGGGAAGHQIAYNLREAFDVTLIDPKTYWEVPMAFPRLLVEPAALPARMTYASFLAGVRLVQGHAVAIAENHVDVEGGDGIHSIAFDLAVVATGSRYVDPLIKAEVPTVVERSAQIAAANRQLANARSVVVAGGGPVGVETAAELSETFPYLKVTLVQGASKLLDAAPSKFSAWAEEQLRAMGVDIHYNDLVVEPAVGRQPTAGVRTRLGFQTDADVVVWAAGARPNTAFIAKSWPAVVQKDGLVKTDQFLRVEGHPNIFIAGDITNLPEGRLAITASFHVPSIVSNLTSVLKAGSVVDAKLKPYKPKRPGKGLGKMMIVTLGRDDGLSSFPFGQFRASFIARKMKSENMFVNASRKSVGLATSTPSSMDASRHPRLGER